MKNDFLKDLSFNEQWKAIIKEIEGLAPVVSEWDYRNDNTERMKYESAMRAGYLNCLSRFRD